MLVFTSNQINTFTVFTQNLIKIGTGEITAKLFKSISPYTETELTVTYSKFRNMIVFTVDSIEMIKGDNKLSLYQNDTLIYSEKVIVK